MTEITEKRCSKCGEIKPLDAFYKEKANKKDGHHRWCKLCDRNAATRWRKRNPDKVNVKQREFRINNPDLVKANALRKNYGIELADLTTQLEKQKGCCAICSLPLPRPEVDHNHTSKTIRGLLCGGCNKAIGLLKDSPFNAFRAYEYLLSGGIWQ